jgi:GGDEF domain-containing protein
MAARGALTDGGVNGEALIQNADAAMYRAKKIGYAVHEAQAGRDHSRSDGTG